MKQYVVTPAAGKRLIGKGMAMHPEIQKTLHGGGTIAVAAGTTNGYVAEEILKVIGGAEEFRRNRFFRGITLPPSFSVTETGQLPGDGTFPDDVIISGGVWQKGKTIADIVDSLKEGDIIVKGANALDLNRKRAAIYIGHPKGGTIATALQAVVGRRVRLILAVGLEKRIFGDLDEVARKINSPGVEGPRLLPAPGEVFTELDALELLTGAKAELVAAGGVCGAEGSVWLAVDGEAAQLEAAENLLESILKEPLFSLEEAL
jgi:hypothetical protein